MNRENLANAELAAAINDSQTSITLKTGQGGNFTQFPLVCTMTPPGQLSTKDNSEVVLLTDVTSDTATITRAQYGFSAKSFPIGSIIANGIYKEDFDAIQDAIDLKYDASNPDGFVDATGAASAAPVQSVAGKTGEVSLSQDDVGLPNVDDTADVNKPISTATQTALNAKANASDTVNLTGNQTIAGVKTFSSSPVVPTATTNTQAVNKAQMDTADAQKVNKAGDTMTGPLQNTATSSVTYSQTRGGKRIAFGASSAGRGILYNYTDSIEMLNVLSDGTGICLGNSNDTQVRRGTGFPNGVVSAPVGSTYIDTNATNGAIEWKKATGTGNTGWVVSVGDTGWRNCNSILDTFWDSSGAMFALRRIGSTVYVRLSDIKVGASPSGARTLLKSLTNNAWPVGFGNEFWGVILTSGIGVAGWPGKITPSVATHDLGVSVFTVLSPGNYTTGDTISGNFDYTVRSAWPSTLPGTSA